MRRNRVLPSCCVAVLLIVAVCAEVAIAAHGHGSVETLLAHDITANIEAPRDDFNNDLARNFHSPRLEYNEWLPVGRGDPLKNDPTYDYSPPVLDRVRYWSDGAKDKTSGNDILLLGVPSKKTIGVNKEWNSVPVRRNYYTPGHQHHAVASPNQLPHTVLMPPPLNNFLGGAESVGFWGRTTSASQQRVDTPPGDGFKYRPAASYPGQFTGGKLPEPSITQPITAQFLHHHQPQLQSGSGFNRQQQPPYVTTIRLTTPAGDTVKRPLLKTILQNEHSYPFTKTAMTSTVTEYTSGGFYDAQNINAMAQTIFHPPQTTEYLQPQPPQQQSTKTAPKLNKVIHTQHFTSAGPFVTPVSTHLPAMTMSTTTTTTTRSPMSSSTMSPMITTQPTPLAMTTDSIFSHYKQPATPERWSPYLIIEGHSKVKTYGLNTNDTLMQLPRMVPVTSTKDPIVRHVVNRDPDTGAELSVSHIATKRPPVYEVHTEAGPRPVKIQSDSVKQQRQDESAVDTLLTLLDEASFDEMLKQEGTVENALDGSTATSGSKDSKTRRNVRVTRQIYRLERP
ncbi:mucin-5AC [Anopheles maculipalpis]|uniref:mucin-5AC n=1 Tax=Anopheles maculipalpis TaxID=1496333 RepID=UPI002158F06E|nr:mucin-5AC [Anopheles maculipalpis]